METNINARISLLHKKARTLLKAKHSDEYIIAALKEEGIEEDYAYLIIENVRNELFDRRQFWKMLFIGGFMLIGGLWMNYLSYTHAVIHGSYSYYVFWGIVVAGVVLIIRAIILFK